MSKEKPMSKEDLKRLKESVDDLKTFSQLLMLFFVASVVTLPLILIILVIVTNCH